ncbi:MAG: transglycosylase SLT domain-containing protein [Cyanobacteriota bacterium]|nr:transglycosylase SLT domain-containing protein [Cyanobacteriota bacterium]
MVPPLSKRLPILAIAGLSALTLGMVAALVSSFKLSPPGAEVTEASLWSALHLGDRHHSQDPVLDLALQPPSQRRASLSQSAQGRPSISQQRARYLLALDLIQANQGGQALPLLANLETEYRPLAAYILLARAQAQRASGDGVAAQATEQQLLKDYGNDPAIAPLLYQLGQGDARHWDTLLQRFPDHPKAVEVAHQRLTADPHRADALPLLMTLARAGLHHPQAGAALLRLKTEFADQLRPEDWQTIGFGFWRRDQYALAGPAYAQAPPSPRNLYRAARGYQIGNQRDRAIALFTQLDQQFPQAPETATGLLRLCLSLPDQAALGVLDQVIQRFPDRAAEAMLQRAEALDRLDSADSAAATRKTLLKRYPDSEAAAQIRLGNAHQAADQGDLTTAISWGREVLKHSPASDLAAEAGFWVGQWGRQIGQGAIAQTALEQVIGTHPESYYAWRAAVALGWDVGDFKTVRSKTPAVAPLARRSPLPLGSDSLQELYLLGQDQAAWERWQTEFVNRQDPSPQEQFVDGLMRQSQGDYLDGIYQVASLAEGTTPEQQQAFTELKQRPDYWHGVYPFPYADLIQTWAAQRQLNPLLVVALIRQESRFSPKIRSAVGATGLMQVMPDTARWIKQSAGLDRYDLTDPQDSIQLGTWYLDHTHAEYNNHSLFAVASYNAGPGNVAKWIQRGGYSDADDFAEKIPFPETKGYIRSVFGGYWNYLRLYDPTIGAQVKGLEDRFAP